MEEILMQLLDEFRKQFDNAKNQDERVFAIEKLRECERKIDSFLYTVEEWLDFYE